MDVYDRPLLTLDNNAPLGYFNVEDDAPAVGKLFALQRSGVIRLMVTASTMLEKQRPGEEVDIQTLAAQLTALGIAPEDIFTHPRPMPFATPGEPNTMSYGVHLDYGLHQALHEILFRGRTEPDAKNVDFDWRTYRDRECERRAGGSIDNQAFVELDGLRWRTGNAPLPPTPALDACSPQQRKKIEHILTVVYDEWNNKKCDAEGLYIHASHAVYTALPQHAVFVTSDKNFKRFSKVLKKTNWERLQALGLPGHIMEPSAAVAYFENMKK
jgi:hypothetical protein